METETTYTPTDTQHDLSKVDRADILTAMDAQRKEFFQQLAHAPVTAVAGMVDQANFLSPHEAENLKKRAADLLEGRVAHAKQQAKQRGKELSAKLEEALADMDELKAKAERLTDEAARGLVELDEYREAHERIKRRTAGVDRRVRDVKEQAASVEFQETNTVAYLADLERKYPAIRLTMGGPPRTF